MDNSGTVSKKTKRLEEITDSNKYRISEKWSMIDISCFDSKTTKKERAYALNDFLNKNLFSSKTFQSQKLYHTRKPLSYPTQIIPQNIYKYRVSYDGDRSVRYAPYFKAHSILATVVIDLPRSEIEDEMITCLRENYKLLKKAVKSEDKTIKFKRTTDNMRPMYKNFLKHIIVSDEELYRTYNTDTLRETPKAYIYTIDKK